MRIGKTQLNSIQCNATSDLSSALPANLKLLLFSSIPVLFYPCLCLYLCLCLCLPLTRSTRSPPTTQQGLGAISDTVVPAPDGAEECWRVAPVMTATLSCDHRVVDGAVGAAWLAAFKTQLEQPLSMIL